MQLCLRGPGRFTERLVPFTRKRGFQNLRIHLPFAPEIELRVIFLRNYDYNSSVGIYPSKDRGALEERDD